MSNILDELNRISFRLSIIRDKYKPYNASDSNTKLYGALALAGDQIDFAAHLVKLREPDPRQSRLDVQMGESIEEHSERMAHSSVIITQPDAPWCSICDNPKVACTC